MSGFELAVPRFACASLVEEYGFFPIWDVLVFTVFDVCMRWVASANCSHESCSSLIVLALARLEDAERRERRLLLVLVTSHKSS